MSQLEASAAAAAALPLSAGLQLLSNHQQRRAARRTAPSGNSGSSGPPSGSKRSREEELAPAAVKKVRLLLHASLGCSIMSMYATAARFSGCVCVLHMMVVTGTCGSLVKVAKQNKDTSLGEMPLTDILCVVD